MFNKGIAIAGNILTDIVKTIDCYPKMGMLSNISNISRGVGGCVPNTAINLKKIDNSVPVFALGKIGDDDNGKYAVEQMQLHGIDCKGVVTDESAPTSFSDVMSILGGERTFFHARGANAKFGIEDINLDALECDIFHIGYLLLLDKFDEKDSQYGTVMARLLKQVQDKGIKTSVDAVSDSSSDFPAIIKPALKYCDYIIFNEVECCNIWGIEPCDSEGNPIIENIKEAMLQTLKAGVREKVVVHCKKVGFCLDKSGQFTIVPSLSIPRDMIMGSVGAGDSFCAAALYSIYNEFSDEK